MLQTLDELLLQNPDAPTNDEYAREFARKLYPHRDERTASPTAFDFSVGRTEFSAADDENVDSCGEASRGLLDAVLSSHLLSGGARDEINAMIEAAAPPLERTKTVGHFRFAWTEASSNPTDNTREDNIDATAAVLNDCWDRYVADFREPKAALIEDTRIIDIVVYYNLGLHGSTSSHSNRIFLNSRMVVNDDCRRRTISAHELFHRVEYSYGYVTGTYAQKWWVEALGSWSQEYYAPNIDDYINRVNAGLMDPGRSLLTRSYDACHYWKYLGEQISQRSAAVGSEAHAIREVLEEYSRNGLDAKAASGTVTQSRVSRSFDRFFQDWSKTNYIKDLSNWCLHYDYAEDETVTTSCGRQYGPYRHVAPETDVDITSNTFTWTSGRYAANAYGTRYHKFDIAPSVTHLKVRLADGAGTYSVHFVMIKNDRASVIYNNPTEYMLDLTFTAGQYDGCLVVVNGLVTPDPYELSVNPRMSGVWRDSFNFVWALTQSRGTIAGTVETRNSGIYEVSGTLDGNDLVLNATGSDCDFVCKGKVVDGDASASGDWTNDRGSTGTWSIAKTDSSDATEMLDGEEFPEDPATMRSGQ